MIFTFDLPTYKDKKTVLNMLERQLVCEHPRTACAMCVQESACMFFAYLHNEINREAKKQKHFNDRVFPKADDRLKGRREDGEGNY